MSEEVFDVAMLSTGSFHAELEEFQAARPPSNDLMLGDDLWVGHLPHGISSSLVFDACSAAGLNFHPIRQFGCRYSVCRRVESDRENYYQWDADGWLSRVLFLSRLIRPTTIGTSLSAKLYFEEGELRSIVPGPVAGLGSHAWVVGHPNWRDWLSVAEFTHLKESLISYSVSPPSRVRQARRHIDHVFHSYYLDQRCASLVTGFESLLKVSPNKATRQFAVRAASLAKQVGLELTELEAVDLYRDRSAFVHGTQVSFGDLSPELIDYYNRFESVLRFALLKASTDCNFAAIFESVKDIEASFGSV